MALTASINTSRLQRPEKVSVSINPVGTSANVIKKLTQLTDIDTTNLNDKGVLQYNASTGKFVVKDNDSADLVVDGGTF